MPKRFRRDIRIPGYDYSQPGGYFITLVTYDRKCIFGEIIEDQMYPNVFGKVILEQWDRLPFRFPGVNLSERVLMPNHFHGIILLSEDGEVENVKCESGGRRSLGTILRTFKSAVTSKVRLITNENTVIWQSNYYEHVIRDEREMQKIVGYIQTNPLRWGEDRFLNK